MFGSCQSRGTDQPPLLGRVTDCFEPNGGDQSAVRQDAFCHQKCEIRCAVLARIANLLVHTPCRLSPSTSEHPPPAPPHHPSTTPGIYQPYRLRAYLSRRAHLCRFIFRSGADCQILLLNMARSTLISTHMRDQCPGLRRIFR